MAKSKATALAPHWLDPVIEGALKRGDPDVIARAIASSKQFTDAIRRGLAKKREGKMEASQAQIIRQEILSAIKSSV
jgi:hypothetical protein